MTFIKRTFGAAMAVCLLTMGLATGAHATTITVEMNFTLTHDTTFGPDAAGLDGALINFIAIFDGDDTYIDRFGQPAVAATSHLFTVSGASVAATNGTYQEANGISFFPNNGNFDGFFNGNGRGIFLPGIQTSSSGLSGGSFDDRAVGDSINASDFLGTFPSFRTNWRNVDAGYNSSDITISATSDDVAPVPLPAGLPLLLGALGVFGVARRYKHA